MKTILLAMFVMLLSTSSYADTPVKKYADWVVNSSIPGIGLAETYNGSQSTFGYLCIHDTGECQHYLISNNTCEEGQVIEILINSMAGSGSLSGECTKLGGKLALALSDADMINRALEGGGNIGFSIPLDSGKFVSSRFSSVGSVLAIKAMMRPTAKQNLLEDETF